MKRRAALLFLALASGASLQAQERQDRVRLDDFALPAPEQPAPVEQVSSDEAAPLPEQARDRTLARPARTEPASATTAQLSAPDENSEVAQLATRSQSRAALAGAAANPRDRVPGAVQRIGGQDRCDPQAEKAAYAECLRILELRAAEFSAPGPAVLSPEQRLLGELRQPEERLTGTSAAMRLRYATASQPDADLQSNQELASVYLQTPETPVQQEPAEPDKNASLAELLQNLGIQTTTPAGDN